MEALLAKLKELESQLSKLEEANAHDEQMKEALCISRIRREEQQRQTLKASQEQRDWDFLQHQMKILSPRLSPKQVNLCIKQLEIIKGAL
jgi:hypothetical protein